MSSFSIDDVRETFTADMTNLLGHVARAADELGASPLLDATAWEGLAPHFAVIADSNHAISGTSGLVAATSLHESAKLMETLAGRGKELIARAASDLSEARRLAALCVSGAEEMRAMLALELDRRGADALRLAEGFAARVAGTSSTPPGEAPAAVAPFVEGSSSVSGFAFPDSAAPRSDSSNGASVGAELLEVFREEAADLARTLAEQLAALRERPGDTRALREVERVYHTLKGAAATVGLGAARAAAASLQEIAEAASERGEPVTTSFLDALLVQTNRMLHEVDLDPITPFVPAVKTPAPPTISEFSFDDASTHPPLPARAQPSLDSSGDELRAIFEEEVREAITAVGEHLRQLAADPANVAALTQTERLFHTVKGAAATVGRSEVSALAASLQHQVERAIDGKVRVSPELIASLREKSARLERAAITAADSVVPARAMLLEEARQLSRSARALSAQLPTAGGRASLVRDELGRIFHRLKGSALVASEREIGEEAARLQALCEAPGDLSEEALTRGVDRLDELVAERQRASDPVDTAVPPPAAVVTLREAVTIPDDAEVWETFNQECLELFEKVDRCILDLESSDRPKHVIERLTGLFHTLKGTMNAVGLAPTGRDIHQVEDFLEALSRAAILPPMRGVASLLLRVETGLRANLATAKQGWVETAPGRIERQIEQIFASGKLEAEPRGRAALSVETGPRHAPGEQSERSERSGATGPEATNERKYIRVGTERLDALMNLAGELVVARSRLLNRVGVLRRIQGDLAGSRRRLVDTVDQFRTENEFSLIGQKAPAAASDPQAAAAGNFSDLELDRYDDVNILARSLAEITDDVNETNVQLLRELGSFADDSDIFGTIVSGIQGEVTRARMVPLEAVFSRLVLPVRDAAEREGKEVRIVTVGEDVSLDKTIADALFSPLLHLVRNAVVHGIEPAAARARAGKSAAGVVKLVAREESGQIIVEIHDDGRGLDLSALRARGIEMGLLTPSTPLDHPSVRELVFAPRLSTLASAGAVAGRGMGGDVIRRSIERLNGNIRVEHAPGQGSSFLIRLPTTLAITKALILRHQGSSYAVPLHFAQRIVEIGDASIVESMGVSRLKVGDGYLALRSLDSLLHLPELGQRRGPVLLLHVGDQQIALKVDAVIGQEEIVVKSLGDVLTGHPLFAGVTIRGNGELVLIFDVPALVEGGRRAREDEAPATPALDKEARRASAPELASASAAPSGASSPIASSQAASSLGAPSPAAPLRGLRPAVEPTAAPRIRVLFVDDSLSVRKVAEKALTSLGAEVFLAVDGVDALARLRETTVDLVFTDLEMPRMHGYELIRELRFVPAYNDLPIVVISSRSAQKHQEQARLLGASGYLTKPFTVQALAAALERWARRGVPGASGR